MLTRTLPALVFGLAALPWACAQSTPRASDATLPVAAQKGPTILKREVDGLIAVLRQTANEDGSLGNGTCLETAEILTAAGHCHRFYHAGDGPWIRRALDSIFGKRRGTGAFGDGSDAEKVTATQWTVAALEVMDPAKYATEIDASKRYLESQQAPFANPFVAMVEARLEETRRAEDRKAALEAGGRAAAKKGEDTFQGKPMKGASALVETVSYQAAARQLGRVRQAEAALARTWLPIQQQGLDFLMTQQKGGKFGVEFRGQWMPDVGLSGIGLAALQTKPSSLRSEAEQKTIDDGLAWLMAQRNAKDGSFGERNVNYSTCSVVMALAATKDPRYAEAMKQAQTYILALQNVEGRDYAPGDRDYGSIGYGGDQRGDVSNLQFALEALTLTGLEENHEAFAKALVFLSRTQNLRESNDFRGKTRDSDDGSWHNVEPGNDGGSAYYPGNSPAGYQEMPDGTRIPRSYGSMTYALLKAYILCGLPPDDKRVVAAVSWIQKNWDLSVNPGVDPKLGEKAAYQGLYYYYMVCAQALDLVGMPKLEITGEADVDWRAAMREHLGKLQRPDGSWVNAENGRWWEDQPMLCTSYALLALTRCGTADGAK